LPQSAQPGRAQRPALAPSTTRKLFEAIAGSSPLENLKIVGICSYPFDFEGTYVSWNGELSKDLVCAFGGAENTKRLHAAIQATERELGLGP
jgi:hypothetical protein